MRRLATLQSAGHLHAVIYILSSTGILHLLCIPDLHPKKRCPRAPITDTEATFSANRCERSYFRCCERYWNTARYRKISLKQFRWFLKNVEEEFRNSSFADGNLRMRNIICDVRYVDWIIISIRFASICCTLWTYWNKYIVIDEFIATSINFDEYTEARLKQRSFVRLIAVLSVCSVNSSKEIGVQWIDSINTFVNILSRVVDEKSTRRMRWFHKRPRYFQVNFIKED